MIGGGPVDVPLVESLLDSSPDAVIAVDDSGIVRFANARAAIIFGWSKDLLVGCHLGDLIPTVHRGTHEALFRSFLADPDPRPMNAYRIVDGLHSSGRHVRIQVALTPVHSSQGIHVGAWIREHRPDTP